LPAENPSTISVELLVTIRELQSLESLREFALAGGTSLAIRFNHRLSHDIDLFTNKIVGKEGFAKIEMELRTFYNTSLMHCELINDESGDQYCFLRALIHRDSGTAIKVEILQNMAIINSIEMIDDIRIISTMDIGLFKLMSAANRKAKKDIYDLDYVTEKITLDYLLLKLEEKHSRFCEPEHKCLFDLDGEVSPNDNLALLLEFDNVDYTKKESRPNHSTDTLDIVPGNKTWTTAKSSWRKKVRSLIKEKGLQLPPVQPIG
jgi:hypothetical protein